MGTFSAISIPKPKDWQDFERKSRVLFECILNDPQTQTHGRGGQEQFGVDIFGRRGGGTGCLVGVQCKGKSGEYGKGITDTELRHEVEKVKKFKPPLCEFILITTAPDDVEIQERARLLEAEIRKRGQRLSIAVWGWNTLEQRISEHHRALKAFHPDATPIADQLLEGIQRNIADHQRHDTKLDYLIGALDQLDIHYRGQLPSSTRLGNVDHLFHIITALNALDFIESEKGTRFGRFKTWPAGSLFQFIDRGMRPGRASSPFKRFPNLVCDDGGIQLADFIGWDNNEPRIAFVHAKCSHEWRGRSLSPLHDVCHQVIKSLLYLRYDLRSLPGFVTKWSRPWSLQGMVVESRIRAGGKSATEARTDFLKQVENSRTQREVWIVLGRILSAESLYRELKNTSIKPHILQAVHFMTLTREACQSVGASLRIFCSP